MSNHRQAPREGDGGEPSMHSEDADRQVARVAQILRDGGFGCSIGNLVPTKTLRRDSLIVILALALLTALAWSYLLWLSADMDVGGMDMSGFRMIPSGMGLMVRSTRHGARWSSHLYSPCGP